MRNVILITGCSKGFGYLFALTLARAGYQVVATSRALSRMQDLQAQALREALPLDCLEMDVTRPDMIRSATQKILHRYGKIDVLVNNAGYGLYAYIEDASPEEINALFQTNVMGLIAVSQAVIPIMKAQHSGRIINISSAAVGAVLPTMGFYAATKWAVEAISEAMVLELNRFGIAISVIQPGPFRTAFSDAAIRNPRTHEQGGGALHAKMHLLPKENPQKVADLLLRIVQSRRPRFHYSIGATARLVFALRKLLPDSWFLKIEAALVNRLKTVSWEVFPNGAIL